MCGFDLSVDRLLHSLQGCKRILSPVDGVVCIGLHYYLFCFTN